MALVEQLDNLPVSILEQLLRECMKQREDITGRILSSEELSDYIHWMVQTYGHLHGKATQEMLPFFTSDNGMTRLAEQISSSPDNRLLLSRLSNELSVHSEEGYIAPGHDIAVGRMLRFYPGHWHTTTYFNVYFAFSGNCPIHFQDEVIHLKRGNVLIVAPGILHATPCYEEDSVLVFYMMRSDTFRSVFWNQLGDDNLLSKFFRLALEGEQATSYLYFDTQDDHEIRHLLLQIYREQQEDHMYASQMINSLMRLFFLLILRRYEGTARLPRTEYFFWKHQFSAILSFIQTHYQHITLQDVATRFHYSSKQVGRIVQDCTGENFGDLIRSMKLKKAAELLYDRRLSPEQIADLVGYSTVNSFYRAFKDYYGSPPLEWIANK